MAINEDNTAILPQYNKSIGFYRFIFSVIIIVLHLRSMHPSFPKYSFWGGIWESNFSLY